MQTQSSPASVTTWDDIASFVREKYVVVQEWPSQGFIIAVDGTFQQHRLFVARNNPGWGGVDHVTIEAALGSPDTVDVLAAAKSASRLMGGVVCAEDFITIRDSRCISTLALPHLANVIAYMSGCLEGYLLSTGGNGAAGG